MSRGLGHVQRAVRAAFLGDPNHIFSTADLMVAAFPGVTPSHKHLVSVLRAANKVVKELGWLKRRCGGTVDFMSPQTAAHRQQLAEARRGEITKLLVKSPEQLNTR